MKLPIVIENSRIPVWLSKVYPIELFALSFGFLIICRSKIPPITLNHETIHYHQQKELMFIGQWFLYAVFMLYGFIKFKDGKKAYYKNPFEQEAYANQNNPDYLQKRAKFAWTKFEIKE